MTKRSTIVAIAALALVLAGGGLFASNMGFKLNYQLTGPGVAPIDGTNTIALPFNQQTGLNDANDLGLDMGGFECANIANPVVNLQRYNKASAGLDLYDGCFGTAFSLVAGESYRVKLNQDLNYIIVGSHDPSKTITLTGPGVSPVDGTNAYGYPYHAVAADAAELGLEIGGFECANVANPVVNIQKYNKISAGLELYDGCFGTAFALNPGEGYRIKVNTDLAFSPQHY